MAKWLPAEVLAFYAAAVTMMQPPLTPEGQPTEPPVVSWWAWSIALAATPVFVYIGALYRHNFDRFWLRVGLSLPAFVLWSATVPYSAWYDVSFFESGSAIFWLALGLAAAAFTAIASHLAPPAEE
ncbi:hypothetical protein LWC34_10090 [Kibdelosporangium philippinense]|uniref:Uncharacterized protein n=1 Tax=Kibdelosporangium philippinense TaxID=211113 RepID=A0ABS8ZBJ3_9PSEU|nr:hypothetical protein [Kibdelosporangium philippinense]MCE7003177.1 hypothetical protein [Kibdelosporangium philippinense]